MIPHSLSEVRKTNDANGSSFDLQGITRSLSGGKTDDLINKVKGIFGM